MNPLLIINCAYCKASKSKRNIKKHEALCFYNPACFKYCYTCNTQLFNRNKFCNNSCAATSTNKYREINRQYVTAEWKLKISIKNKQNWQNGKISYSQKRLFSSKKEREIVSFFKENFPNDEWKSGGRLKLNDTENLSRDMWSDKLRICFEYDGIWHFKNIHGQLNKKQIKDRLLEQWCIANNYRLIRVDEDSYIDIQQIKDLIYNKQDQIIKIGDRY